MKWLRLINQAYLTKFSYKQTLLGMFLACVYLSLLTPYIKKTKQLNEQ